MNLYRTLRTAAATAALGIALTAQQAYSQQQTTTERVLTPQSCTVPFTYINRGDRCQAQADSLHIPYVSWTPAQPAPADSARPAPLVADSVVQAPGVVRDTITPRIGTAYSAVDTTALPQAVVDTTPAYTAQPIRVEPIATQPALDTLVRDTLEPRVNNVALPAEPVTAAPYVAETRDSSYQAPIIIRPKQPVYTATDSVITVKRGDTPWGIMRALHPIASTSELHAFTRHFQRANRHAYTAWQDSDGDGLWDDFRAGVTVKIPGVTRAVTYAPAPATVASPVTLVAPIHIDTVVKTVTVHDTVRIQDTIRAPAHNTNPSNLPWYALVGIGFGLGISAAPAYKWNAARMKKNRQRI
jgi:hypothetical protein